MNSEQNIIREPELYDIFNRRERDDIKMYLSLFDGAEKVLELGVGTGRIALPLAENGICVVGVDNSDEMIISLKSKLDNIQEKVSSKVKIVHQDFCDLDIQDTFNFAFYPFCTFNYLLSITQQTAALISLKKHLNKGAEVIFDLMTVHTFPNLLYNTHNTYYDSATQGDLEISIATQSSFDQSTQIYAQERNFEYYRRTNVVFKKRVKMINRIFFIGELQLLFEKCGYKIIKICGDYNLSKFSPTSRCLIIIATPA
jgi:SAM-dependent methyltransferase